jgi:uncharacterized membrane protein
LDPGPLHYQGFLGSACAQSWPDSKPLAALRTAIATEYKLDKDQTSYHDIFDAFRLSLSFTRGPLNNNMSTQYNRNTSTTPPVNDIPVSLSSNEFLGVGLEDKDYFVVHANERFTFLIQNQKLENTYVLNAISLIFLNMKQ